MLWIDQFVGLDFEEMAKEVEDYWLWNIDKGESLSSCHSSETKRTIKS